MTPKPYTTVAFELELLQEDGECFVCHRNGNLYWPGVYAVRNHDGPLTLISCRQHLELLIRGWDSLTQD